MAQVPSRPIRRLASGQGTAGGMAGNGCGDETAVVEKDAYKDLVAPSDMEAYPEPDHDPEVRERYWEFWR